MFPNLMFKKTVELFYYCCQSCIPYCGEFGFLVELAVFSTRYVGYFAHENVLMFKFVEWPWKRARDYSARILFFFRAQPFWPS